MWLNICHLIKVFHQVLLFPVVARLQPCVQSAYDGQDWGLHPLLQHARGPQPGQVQPGTTLLYDSNTKLNNNIR